MPSDSSSLLCSEDGNCNVLHSLSDSVNDTNPGILADLKHKESTNQIYHEYDPPRLQGVSASWKVARPTFLGSWYRCVYQSFILTVIYGAAMAVIMTSVSWLDLNLAGICYQFNGNWYKMPHDVQNIRLTSQVVKAIIVQWWPMSVFLPVFGWKLVKQLNLLPWTMLASFIDANYRLFLHVYQMYNRTWSAYAMNAVFGINLLLCSYRIASHYRQATRQSLQFALKLGAQFYMSFPTVLMFNYLILPYFQALPENSKAVIASLSPALWIIPKAVARLCSQNIEGVSRPGTSVLFLIIVYIVPPIIIRILQAKLHGFWVYFGLCIVHGIASTFDKITLPLQDYILKKCCAKRHHVSKHRKPNASRLLADLAIISIIAESSAIISSSAIIQILRYYYGRDDNGEKYRVVTLLEAGSWRAATGMIVEFLFNTIAIKIQTYYYNIPVIRVWKTRKWWMIAMFLLHIFIGMFYMGEYTYDAVRSKNMFSKNMTEKCTKPFHRP